MGLSALSHSDTLLTPFPSPRLCVQPLSSHSNPLLTLSLPIFDSQWVGPSFFLQLNPCLIFVSQAPYISFLVLKSTTHSIFVSQGVRPFPFSHLNPLLTPFLCSSGYVHFLSCTYIHSLLHFHIPAGASISFLALKSTAQSIFISKGVCPFPFLDLNPLLTPFSCPSG